MSASTDFVRAQRKLTACKAVLLSVLNALFTFALSAPSTAYADSLRYLPRGDQALVQMTELIESAKHTIDLTYYIVDPCAISTQVLLGLLEKKALAGVRVRMIIDAHTHSNKLQRTFRQSLMLRGIDLRYYNYEGLSPISLNYRTHAKFIIADGQRYITGGRNLADDYFGLEDENFIDRDVYVEGASASAAQEQFNSFWSLKRVYTPSGPATPESVRKLDSECAEPDRVSRLRAALDSASNMQSGAALDAAQGAALGMPPLVSCSEVQFTMDDPEFWQHANPREIESEPISAVESTWYRLEKKQTTQSVLKFLADDVHSLTLENWSYIPSPQISWILRDLRERHVPVVIVTNRSTDVGGSIDVLNRENSVSDNTGSEKIYALSELGSMNSAWSQTPENAKWMIHSKVFVANSDRVAITSFNIDFRSYHTNIESGFFVRHCPIFASQVLAETQTLIRNFDQDRSCRPCQETSDLPVAAKIKAWILQEFL